MNMFTRKELKRPDLETLFVRAYLFIEPFPILFILSEHTGAGAVHQVVDPQISTKKLQTARVARDTLKIRLYNAHSWRLGKH